jgi:hypothetical protein
MLAEYTVARFGVVPVGRTCDDLAELLERAPVTLGTFAADYRDCWTR